MGSGGETVVVHYRLIVARHSSLQVTGGCWRNQQFFSSANTGRLTTCSSLLLGQSNGLRYSIYILRSSSVKLNDTKNSTAACALSMRTKGFSKFRKLWGRVEFDPVVPKLTRFDPVVPKLKLNLILPFQIQNIWSCRSKYKIFDPAVPNSKIWSCRS